MTQLTKPTRGRVALWAALTFAWALLLVQALLMQPIQRTYWPGAIFWAVVQASLVWMTVATWRRRRLER